MAISRFWKSKKFWIILIIIGIGFLVYCSFFKEEIIFEELFSEEKYDGDVNKPYSQIQNISSNNWQTKDFQIRVLDEDSESGIKENSCQYKVLSYNSNGEEVSSGWRSRKCNSNQIISIGPEGKCRFEGNNSCWVYVRSQDKAGNWYSPSEEELSIKSYNIDWTGPYVSRAIIKEGKTEIETIDALNKITGCFLYIDGESQGTMRFLDKQCGNQCFLEKEFILSGAGIHNIYAYCRDSAGNWEKGESEQVTINTPPTINYCKGLPTSGNKNTEIRFTVEAEDIDNNNLSFSWDFGDGNFSQEENPVYSYSKSGTFHPIITVLDGESESSCSTAWITIAE